MGGATEMASLEYLREEMQRAREMMDDPNQPSTIRHASRNRFWHCYRRVGAMERGGLTHDEPGHFMLGYSEQGYSGKKRSQLPLPATPDNRREHIDRKTEVQIASRERL